MRAQFLIALLMITIKPLRVDYQHVLDDVVSHQVNLLKNHQSVVVIIFLYFSTLNFQIPYNFSFDVSRFSKKRMAFISTYHSNIAY